MSTSAMMGLQERIPDFGRDIRLNLDSVLGPEGAPGLSAAQIAQVALGCAYAVEDPGLARAIEADHAGVLSAEAVQAAKGAAVIMAMNNVYYRALHLAGDAELSKLPARLRMSFLGRSGIAKTDLELISLAVSAIGGCGACVASHTQELRKAGVSSEGIQSALRIASVVHAARKALWLGEFSAKTAP